jgi:hypothetical protein
MPSLTADTPVLIDECDRELFEAHTWYVNHGALFNSRKGLFHRLIMDAPPDKYVDHINGNRLDNRRENLRLVTPKGNSGNVHRNKRNTSGYRGVYWNGREWVGNVQHEGKRKRVCSSPYLEFTAALTSTWRTLYMEGAVS